MLRLIIHRILLMKIILSVPYFTGFVMLLPCRRGNRLCCRLSVPYFTGFVMLRRRRLWWLSCVLRLSVPYFTGFVMLLFFVINNIVGIKPFSPLFYGIRDATQNMTGKEIQACNSFSPLFYGIRDATIAAPITSRARGNTFSPLFYGIRDATSIPLKN